MKERVGPWRGPRVGHPREVNVKVTLEEYQVRPDLKRGKRQSR